jgi:membrane peptidoglycan carboxypeptidase
MLPTGVVLVLAGAMGASHHSAGPPSAGPAPTSSVAVPVRPSFLYASDGSTRIARFDAADPKQNCLAVKTNAWGFFCDYLVSWWKQQPRLAPLRNGGYRIVGSLDVGLQAAAASRVRAVPNPKVFSVVTVQPGTGLVRTMAVNRTYGVGARPSTASDPDRGTYVANAADVTYGPTTTAPFATGGDDVYGSPAGQTFEPFTLAAALEQGIPLSHTINTKRRFTSSYVIDRSSPAACDGVHWCPANPDGSSASATCGRR